MKSLGLWIIVATWALSAAGASPAGSAAGHEGFERLKSLEGEWVGPAVWDRDGEKGSAEFSLSYKVTSAGKIVTETMMPGTPGEMLTVYYLDGADLSLVHFCTAGNQPRMKLEWSGKPDEFAFKCTGSGTNMTEGDSHMHSARIRIVDANHITGVWSSTKDGHVEWIAEAQLERQKSDP